MCQSIEKVISLKGGSEVSPIEKRQNNAIGFCGGLRQSKLCHTTEVINGGDIFYASCAV